RGRCPRRGCTPSRGAGGGRKAQARRRLRRNPDPGTHSALRVPRVHRGCCPTPRDRDPALEPSAARQDRRRACPRQRGPAPPPRPSDPSAPRASADLSRRCVLRNQPSSVRETPSPCNTPVKSDRWCRCSGCRGQSRLVLACEVTIAEFLSSKRTLVYCWLIHSGKPGMRSGPTRRQPADLTFSGELASTKKYD